MKSEMSDWIASMSNKHPDLDLRPPANVSTIESAEAYVGPLPEALSAFYRSSNGLENRSFRIFPLFDPADAKKTWDSLQRVNTPKTTTALGGDEGLLRRFLVFADIGNGYAAFDRAEGTIWFEESGSEDVKETDLTFREFVEIMLANAE